MRKNYQVIVLSIIVIMLCLSPVMAFSLSDWLKNIFSGKVTAYVVEGSSGCDSNYSYVPIVSGKAVSILSQNYAESNAFDNNPNTRWSASTTPELNPAYSHWIYFDLGAKKCVKTVELYMATYNVPATVDIQVSNDSNTWYFVKQGWQITQSNSYQASTNAVSAARYVRIDVRSIQNNVGTIAEARIIASNYTEAVQQPQNTSSPQNASFCIDSDSGKNYTIKGFVNSSNGSSPAIISNDSCYSETGLSEYFCDNSVLALDTYTCAAGCNEGACLPEVKNMSNVSVQNPPTPIEEEYQYVPSTGSGTCGAYNFVTPRDARASSQFNNYRASHAIDNDANTHWFGDPNAAYPKWIYFDLGEVRCINAVELNAFIWDAPIMMEIQVSNDAADWETVASGVTISAGGQFVRENIPETRARYVRVYETAGKRSYGTLSEIRVNTASYGDASMVKIPVLKEENILGNEAPEKFYVISGRRAFIEIDGKPVA